MDESKCYFDQFQIYTEEKWHLYIWGTLEQEDIKSESPSSVGTTLVRWVAIYIIFIFLKITKEV